LCACLCASLDASDVGAWHRPKPWESFKLLLEFQLSSEEGEHSQHTVIAVMLLALALPLLARGSGMVDDPIVGDAAPIYLDGSCVGCWKPHPPFLTDTFFWFLLVAVCVCVFGAGVVCAGQPTTHSRPRPRVKRVTLRPSRSGTLRNLPLRIKLTRIQSATCQRAHSLALCLAHQDARERLVLGT